MHKHKQAHLHRGIPQVKDAFCILDLIFNYVIFSLGK